MAKKSREEQKKRQKETLRTMKETRYEDAIYLRDYINKKLDWNKKELEKGIEMKKNLELQLENVKQQILRLQGSQFILKELSNLKKPIESENKDEPDKSDI